MEYQNWLSFREIGGFILTKPQNGYWSIWNEKQLN